MPYESERQGPIRIVGPGFHERVYRVVSQVPEGFVTTYGDVAAVLGLRSVARKVGHALAALPAERHDVPWHRVVNAQGRISRPRSTSQGCTQRRLLEAEGVEIDADGRILDFEIRRFVLRRR